MHLYFVPGVYSFCLAILERALSRAAAPCYAPPIRPQVANSARPLPSCLREVSFPPRVAYATPERSTTSGVVASNHLRSQRRLLDLSIGDFAKKRFIVVACGARRGRRPNEVSLRRHVKTFVRRNEFDDLHAVGSTLERVSLPRDHRMPRHD